MRIKEILRELLSGEDFSDHLSGPQDGHGPLHDKGCAFCAAWHAALVALGSNILEFEPSDLVELPGGTPGRVIAVETFVRVEVQNGEHGPWATGSFRPQDLVPRKAGPDFTWWRDNDGAVWQHHVATGRVLMIRDEDGETPSKSQDLMQGDPRQWPRLFDGVEKRWGPLVEVQAP